MSALEKIHISCKYVEVINDVCNGALTNVRTVGDGTSTFPIIVGLYHCLL